MAILRVYKRNSTFAEMATLAEEIGKLGLKDTLKNITVNQSKRKQGA